VVTVTDDHSCQWGTGSAFLTAEQREWVATQKLINSIPLKIEIERPQHPLRLFCWRIVTWQYFEPLIISCIVLNMAIMCLQVHTVPSLTPDDQLSPCLCLCMLPSAVVLSTARRPDSVHVCHEHRLHHHLYV